MSLRRMQREHREWQHHNFPDQTPEQAFMGMVEEMGEIAHAMLKMQQKIRGMDEEKALELIIDGHCDWLIFSLGFANGLGYNVETELEKVWAKVKQRDWIANPTDAHEKVEEDRPYFEQ